MAKIDQLERQIRAAGFAPRRRNMFYDRVDETGRIVQRHRDPAWGRTNAAGDSRPAALAAELAALEAAS